LVGHTIEEFHADAVDETGVDIIDALDIFMLGMGEESKDFTEKEIRTGDGIRCSSPAAEILASRGKRSYIMN
jgi:hypothetical protein